MYAIRSYYVCVVTVAGAESALSMDTEIRETVASCEAVEMHLPIDQSITPWIHDPAIFEKDEGDRTETRKVVEQNFKTRNNFV